MQLIKIFLSQCLFRKLPKDWSISLEAYKGTSLFYLSVFWILQALLMGEASEAFVAALCELILTQVFVFAVLSLTGRRRLVLPAATFIMGAESILGLLAVPVIVWLRVAERLELLVAFYSLVLIALWALAVLGHVFRQVLAKPSSFGFGVAFAYALETYLGTLLLLVL